MAKRFSHRRVKRHREYTIQEAARVTGAHPRTVVRWIKRDGLAALTEQRPWLIAGADLKTFLGARATRIRSRMAAHQFYCLTCKCPREAALKMADYNQTTATSGMLTALCAVCDTLVHKAVKRSDLEAIRAKVEVTIQRAPATLVSESALPSNVTFSKEVRPHVKAQG